AAYVDGDGPVAVDPQLGVADPDSDQLTGAEVEITGGRAEDVLAFTPLHGITGSFTAGTLTLTGTASVAEYQDVLRTVTFTNPTSHPGTQPRPVSFTTDDGTR